MGSELKQIIGRIRCPSCASKGGDSKGDNLVLYSDGGAYCYSCGYYESDGQKQTQSTDAIEEWTMDTLTLAGVLGKRGISSTVAARYGATLVADEEGNMSVRVPITDANGKEAGAQYRAVDSSSGSLTREMRTKTGSKLKVPCFGVNTITKLTKVLLLCEGWTDAMIASTAMEGRTDVAVLGICGATFAKRSALYISRYCDDKRIVLAFDNDDAGDKAKEDFVATMAQHSPDKVLHKLLVPASHKDIGDWVAKDKPDLYQCVEQAPPIFSSNLLSSDDVGDRLLSFLDRIKTHDYIHLNFSPTLDNAVKLMPGKLIGVLGDAGQGKSTFAEHLMLEAITQKKRVFCVSAEMSAEEVALKLMRTIKKEPLHLPKYLDSLEPSYFAEVVSETKRVLSWLTLVDNFGVVRTDRIDSYLLELAAANRMPSVVVVDHLLAIAESLEPNALQKTCEELKGLARKHQVCVILLCHTKKPQNQTKRTVYRPMLADAYGSNGLAIYADVVLAVAKDQPKKLTYVETVKPERLIGEYADVMLAFEDWTLSETQDESMPIAYDNDEATDVEETDVY